MKQMPSTITLVFAMLLGTGCLTAAPPSGGPTQQAAPLTASPAPLDMQKARTEVDTRYAGAHPEIREYVLWTAQTFGRSGMWLNEDAFAALPAAVREDRIQYLVTLLEQGEYGRHLCAGLAEASALADRRLVPGLMKMAGYHREDLDYDCRPKWMAVAALARQESDAAVPLLVSLVDHGNQNTRNWARAALARKTGKDFAQDKLAWAKWWQEQGHHPIAETFLKPYEAPSQNKDLPVTGAANPVFVTSDPNGGWPDGGYYVHNNMWNCARYSPCTSTLHAWSHDNWQVVTRMNNRTGDGAVKTYPNVHRDYGSVPIDSFESITSHFAETSPRVGIYNFAYDIWINGIARPGCTEIMIWTENFNQVPGGTYLQEVTFGSQTYKVYRNPGSGYLAFVATANFTSGTVNLLEIMKWTIAKGWLSSTSTLNQICFGVEIVSTDDTDATFRVTAFSIDAKLRPRLDPSAPASEATGSTRASNLKRSNEPMTK